MEQGKTRLHFLTQRQQNQVKLQRFAQFLRARIDGGKIIECTQPSGQRIIKLVINRGGEITLLWIRLWNNNPNIIATDDQGVILDAFMRRPTQNEVSGGHYHPNLEKSTPAPEFQLREFSAEIPQDLPYWNKIEQFYATQNQDDESTHSRKQAIQLAEKLIPHLTEKLSTLKISLEKAENAQQFKEMGDLIINQLYAIPKGSQSFKTEDWHHNNAEIIIPLDKKLSPAENAESYYKKYRKAKNSLTHLQEEVDLTETHLEQLEKQLIWLRETENLEGIKEWLTQTRQVAPLKKEEGKSIPGLQFHSHGYTLLVGRNAKENDQLLRRHVRGNDLWLHARDYPGGYIFIKTIPNKSVSLETLLDAGNLAIHYSKAKTGGHADLYYTHVKHLRRSKNGPLGLVLPTHEKNLHVVVDEERLNRLLGRNSTKQTDFDTSN